VWFPLSERCPHLKVETSLDLVIRVAPGGSGREFGPGGNCELLEHVAEVSVDGVGRHVQAQGDITIGQSLGDEVTYSLFAGVRLAHPCVARRRVPLRTCRGGSVDSGAG
jgi:hypothetical protein